MLRCEETRGISGIAQGKMRVHPQPVVAGRGNPHITGRDFKLGGAVVGMLRREGGALTKQAARDIALREKVDISFRALDIVFGAVLKDWGYRYALPARRGPGAQGEWLPVGSPELRERQESLHSVRVWRACLPRATWTHDDLLADPALVDLTPRQISRALRCHAYKGNYVYDRTTKLWRHTAPVERDAQRVTYRTKRLATKRLSRYRLYLLRNPMKKSAHEKVRDFVTKSGKPDYQGDVRGACPFCGSDARDPFGVQVVGSRTAARGVYHCFSCEIRGYAPLDSADVEAGRVVCRALADDDDSRRRAPAIEAPPWVSLADAEASVTLRPVVEYALTRLPREQLKASGVVVEPYSARMVWPIRNAAGTLVSYVGRATPYSPREYFKEHGVWGYYPAKKYRNAAGETGDTFFVGPTGDSAIDLPGDIDPRPIVVVEGCLDAAAHMGDTTMLFAAALGTVVSGFKLDRLIEAARRGRAIVLVPDAGEREMAKAMEAATTIRVAVSGARVGIVDLRRDDGMKLDPDEIPHNVLCTAVFESLCSGGCVVRIPVPEPEDPARAYRYLGKVG